MEYPYYTYEWEKIPEQEMLARSAQFLDLIKRRRTVRDYSSEKVPLKVIEDALLSAGSAPSGANMQPWHFVVVSNPELRKKIRKEAEIEEREFYARRASQQWLAALAPLGTDEKKPFLETASHLIVIFARKFNIDAEGNKHKNYYTPESVGIATGMLLTALHNAGVATLTHTPSPMKFLNGLLGRPKHEKPFLILVAGYPEAGAMVPDIQKYTLDQVATFL